MIEVTILKLWCFNLSLHIIPVKEVYRKMIPPATETNKLNANTQTFNRAKILLNKMETKADIKNKYVNDFHKK